MHVSLHKLQPKHYTAPPGLDKALMIAENVAVNTGLSATYTFTLDDGTPVNTHTWVGKGEVAHNLDWACNKQVLLAINFKTLTFPNDTARLDVIVSQKRLASDLITDAPLVGAVSVTPDLPTPNKVFPLIYTNHWVTFPLSMFPYGVTTAARTFFVSIDLINSVVADTATIYLAAVDMEV